MNHFIVNLLLCVSVIGLPALRYNLDFLWIGNAIYSTPRVMSLNSKINTKATLKYIEAEPESDLDFLNRFG